MLVTHSNIKHCLAFQMTQYIYRLLISPVELHCGTCRVAPETSCILLFSSPIIITSLFFFGPHVQGVVEHHIFKALALPALPPPRGLLNRIRHACCLLWKSSPICSHLSIVNSHENADTGRKQAN